MGRILRSHWGIFSFSQHYNEIETYFQSWIFTYTQTHHTENYSSISKNVKQFQARAIELSTVILFTDGFYIAYIFAIELSNNNKNNNNKTV